MQVKRDMVAIKHELDTVQQVKEEIEELREYVDRLEEHTHRRKLRLLEQVSRMTPESITTAQLMYYFDRIVLGFVYIIGFNKLFICILLDFI